jgi:predicted PurR-regulated permease PerM
VTGTEPITLTMTLQQFFAGNTGAGIALAVGALLVATIDNFVRPLFLKGTANLHPLVAFVAAFGGLQTLGVLGIFIGPIIAGLSLATIDFLIDRPEIEPAS